MSVANLVVADSVSNLGKYSNAVSFSLTNTFDASLKSPAGAKGKDLSFSSGSFSVGWLVYGSAAGFSFKSNVAASAFPTSSYDVQPTPCC